MDGGRSPLTQMFMKSENHVATTLYATDITSHRDGLFPIGPHNDCWLVNFQRRIHTHMLPERINQVPT